jgi:hypothetical protein
MASKNRDDVYAVLLATLRPIASMLLRLGVSYRDFDRVAQAAFVAVATSEYGVAGRPANASRVSLMTGLTRKLVSKIQAEPVAEQALEIGGQSLPGEVLNVWHTDFRFCSTLGKPRPLTWDSGSASFCELVSQCSRSVSPATMLGELLRVGAVVKAESGVLIATRRSFIPATAEHRLIQGFQYGLRPLAMTVAHNAAAEDATQFRFQRLVWNYCLPKSQRGDVEALVAQRMKEFSQEIDDLLSEVDRSVGAEDRSVIGVGMYYVEDDPSNFSVE